LVFVRALVEIRRRHPEVDLVTFCQSSSAF
jgi:hypothetical protein